MADYNGNGNGVIKKWHILSVVFAIITAAAKVVFFAGDTSARTEERLANMAAEIQQIKQEYARKDVIDQRLANIESSQKREEDNELALTKALEDIRSELRKRR